MSCKETAGLLLYMTPLPWIVVFLILVGLLFLTSHEPALDQAEALQCKALCEPGAVHRFNTGESAEDGVFECVCAQ